MGISNPDTARHDVAPTRENQEQQQEAADAGYSSAEQARAATELAKMWQAHKAIDTELAGRAKAMLKEMVTGGGDIDVDAVHALLDEAQRRYETADTEVTENSSPFVDLHNEVTEIRPREVVAVLDNSGEEGSEDVTLPLPVSPSRQKFVPPPLPTLQPRQASDMFAGPSPSERAARIASSATKETRVESADRQLLNQQRLEAMRIRDGIQVRLRTADSVQKVQLEARQKEADTLLAQIDAKLKKAA